MKAGNRVEGVYTIVYGEDTDRVEYRVWHMHELECEPYDLSSLDFCGLTTEDAFVILF